MKKFFMEKLKFRIDLMKPIDVPNSNGGISRGYEKITTIWADFKNESEYIRAIRGGNINENNITGHFIVRFESIKNIMKEFSNSFDFEFNNKKNQNPIKSEYFIFMHPPYVGSDLQNIFGRLYKIDGIIIDDNKKEFVKISVREIEEIGTGYVL